MSDELETLYTERRTLQRTLDELKNNCAGHRGDGAEVTMRRDIRSVRQQLIEVNHRIMAYRDPNGDDAA